MQNDSIKIAERRRNLDRSLIGENLKLSPREGLQKPERLNKDLNSLRQAAKT